MCVCMCMCVRVHSPHKQQQHSYQQGGKEREQPGGSAHRRLGLLWCVGGRDGGRLGVCNQITRDTNTTASLSALRTVLPCFIRRKRARHRPDGWKLGSRNGGKRQTGRSARLQEWNQFQSASAIDVRLVKAVMRSGGQKKNLILATGKRRQNGGV